MAREKKAMLVLWQPTHNIGMCVHDDLCVFDCECELLCANCQQTYSIVFSVYCVCDHVGMKRKSVHNEQKTINKKTTKQKELVCLCASECEREKKEVSLRTDGKHKTTQIYFEFSIIQTKII